jgi:hypothetical protein
MDQTKPASRMRVWVLSSLLLLSCIAAYCANTSKRGKSTPTEQTARDHDRFRLALPPGVPVPASVAKQFCGTYYTGDGLGCNIHLTLHPDGIYKGDWYGCLGHYGSATGNWSVSNNILTFSPFQEAEMMKGYLRQLDVVQTEGRVVFVEPRNRAHFKEYGICRLWCFQRQDQIVSRGKAK